MLSSPIRWLWVVVATLAVVPVPAQTAPPPVGPPAPDPASSTRIGNRPVGKTFNFFSLEKKRQLGRERASELEYPAPSIDDSIVTEYVNMMAQNLARRSDAQDHIQGSMALTAMQQRSLFRHCVEMAKVAQGHMNELTRSAVPQPQIAEIKQHLREVQAAASSMFDDHKRLRDSLAEDQWTAVKDRILALEKLRASIQAYLEGIEIELQLPNPDPKVFVRYDKKMKISLQDWQKEHHRMAVAIGNRF